MNENVNVVEVEKPQLSKWCLFFLRKDGAENRAVIAEAFAKFLDNRDQDELEIPGNCYLGGIISGARDSKKNGTYHLDDKYVITKVMRIRRSEYSDGTAHDMLCVVDKSGSRYFMYSDHKNGYMRIMFKDIITKKELDSSPGFYVPTDYRRLEGKWM